MRNAQRVELLSFQTLPISLSDKYVTVLFVTDANAAFILFGNVQVKKAGTDGLRWGMFWISWPAPAAQQGITIFLWQNYYEEILKC